ncbi:hypothetical protein AGMMS50268_03990 [Spirochaetia bacterium]|nr:hypothetical protein AGMMS50268_03990 [Spirochaetia bacterium]
MSTRCLISAKILGKVFTIYCHHDGYENHIIPLLRDHYNTQEKIEALIMMGNTSAIYETLDQCSPYADGSENGEKYENNAPTITERFVLNPAYYFEYYWDGKEWYWSYMHSPIKQISEYKED